jgi:hypothetical protein
MNVCFSWRFKRHHKHREFPPWRIIVNRTVAQAVLTLLCMTASMSQILGAGINSSWTELGQAKASKKSNTVVPFQPELSLDQNNQNLVEHRARSITISTIVPINKVDQLTLVNHAVRWQLEDQVYSGRVTALMLSQDRQSLTVFAEISDPKLDSKKISRKSEGLLSVERSQQTLHSLEH